MDLDAFLNHLNSGKPVKGGSEAHQFMHGVSQEALRLTAEINGSYHEPAKLRQLFSQLIGAPVDFLATRDFVDPEQIGILGICGFGGMALNAAAVDTRIKATVTSTVYDMTRVTARGYFDADDSTDARYRMKKTLNAQRTEDYRSGTCARAGGVVDPLPQDAPFFVKDYYDYYKTQRGYAERSLNSNDGWNVTSSLSFLNMPILRYSNEIRSAVLMIHGEKAHSRYFSRDAYADMMRDNPCTNNKELLIIPDAVHTDLYDRKDVIPFDHIQQFFRSYLK